MIRTHADAVATFAESLGPEGPFAIEGGRTRWDRGGPLTTGTPVVSGPSGILSYEPADMIVRVLCGTGVAELHQELRTAGQRTALPERGGTVGGALAVGEDDLSSPGLGTVRAALLQCTTISADGQLVTGGGPTVKNVSGYDLPKLMVGSLGTLGPLIEVLLRTVPEPPAMGWWCAEDADTMGLRKALYRPTALCTNGTTTWVHLRGHAVDVAAQERLLSAFGAFSEVPSGPLLPPWRWATPRSEVDRWVTGRVGDGVACLLTGRLWRTVRQPELPTDPNVSALHDRMRTLFDPTGRFNPGRDALRD